MRDFRLAGMVFYWKFSVKEIESQEDFLLISATLAKTSVFSKTILPSYASCIKLCMIGYNRIHVESP